MATKKEAADAKRAAKAEAQTRPMHFLKQRPLFTEDLSPQEDARLDQGRREMTSTIPERNKALGEKAQATLANPKTPAAARKTAVKVAGVTAAIQPHLTSVSESRDEAAARIAGRLMHPNASTRLKSEHAAPGASWYVEHNTDIRNASKGIDLEAAAVSSGSMSPLNSPDNEVRALGALSHAQQTNAKTHITPEIAAHVRESVGGKKGNGADFLPDHQVGRSVGFNELHPKVIASLTATSTGEKFPDMETNIDLPGIKRAGTNKTKGIAGLRGVDNNTLNPPAGAPKVNTYTHNGHAFDDVTNPGVKDEIDFRTTDTVRRARSADLDEKEKAGGLSAAENTERTALPGRMDQPLDFNDNHDDSFHMTPHLAQHIASRGGVVHAASVGQQVRMRDQHPATVMAMSHPTNTDASTRGKALLSSNHPTVQDSWANAEVHNQPNISVATTSVRKAGGSETLGYRSSKKLNDGTDIVDSARPGAKDVTPAGLQHADYDKVTRMAAQHVVKKLDLPYDYPSTAAQAVPWVEQRREVPGNKDEAYANARKAEAPPAVPAHHQGLKTWEPASTAAPHSETAGQESMFGNLSHGQFGKR